MQNVVDEVVKEVEKVIFGKKVEIELSLACFFAGGHLTNRGYSGCWQNMLCS